jgi:hypothetical protein
VEIKIKDANGQTNLTIEIISREADAEWLICMANFSYGGFEARIKFSAMLGDFCSFSEELEPFYKTLRGHAQFQSIEDNVSFQLSTDGLGHVGISGYLRHNSYEVKTTFLIHSDQTFLPELLNACKQICVR